MPLSIAVMPIGWDFLISDMQIKEVIQFLDAWAHPSLQESYDNAGLLTGNPEWEVKGILVSLDCTEEIIKEATLRNCNLVIAHHPIVFKGLKKFTGRNYVERTLIGAIKQDVALFAMHTNLDNVPDGVSRKMASLMGLINGRVLSPMDSILRRLSVYVPTNFIDSVSNALFAAGAGKLGNYSECGFQVEGTGSFKPLEGADPFVGKPGERHYEKEAKLELVFPSFLKKRVMEALRKSHPYEEVAYGIFQMENEEGYTGAGIIGEFEKPITESQLLDLLCNVFKIPVVKHTSFIGKSIKKVALCGGAGSFLLATAINQGADAYITSDIKYNEFFDADNRILLADIGHYESEQFTMDLIIDKLTANFPNFAVLKTGSCTNPVRYFTGTQA